MIQEPTFVIQNLDEWKKAKRRKRFIKIMNPVLCVLLLVATVTCGYFMFSTGVNNTDLSAEASTSYRQGSTGSVVKQIQTSLKNKGYYTSTVDGIFGSKTTSAVKRFQKDNGLTVDGIVGTKTASKLGISLSGTTSSSTTNVNLLARLIYGEARGEAYIGQVAVGAVVLNRVKSSLFPNTISGVIYQAGAFDAVRDGQINLTPNSSALQAARDAINGWDPTGGCLYYYNPKTATSKWMLSKTVHLTIGNHAFCL